jgi:hypothetical protein
MRLVACAAFSMALLSGVSLFAEVGAERTSPSLSTGPMRTEKPGRITLEGNDFRAHVQGVCTDGTNIYWSMTYDLVKTDMSGRELARYSDKFHMGDLCWHNGRIYVGVNRTAERGTRRGDEVWVFEPGKLERVKTYPTPQTIWCNNGIEWCGNSWWIIGNLSHLCDALFGSGQALLEPDRADGALFDHIEHELVVGIRAVQDHIHGKTQLLL